VEEYSTFFIGFIAGIIILRIWDYLYATGTIVLSVKTCIKDSILMIAKNVQSVYEINNLKYIALKMSNKDEKYIQFQKALDTRELNSMKNTIIRNFVNSIPIKYSHLVPFSDWGTAIDYINAELQKQKEGKQ
jgi:hypothetical protein